MKCMYILLMVIIACGFAQKPNYISGNVGQPELAYRFRVNGTTTDASLGNRLGEDGTTAQIPIDARGDHELVERLNRWPAENRPYWLINYEAIERFRNQQNQQNNVPTSTVQSVNVQERLGQGGGSSRTSNRVRDQRGFNRNVDYDDFGNPIY